MLAAHAGHTFFSNLNDKTFTFFENPTTIINLPPMITAFSPDSGSIRTAVTLTGNNFVGIQSVTFNGTPAIAFKVYFPTTLIALVPVGATTGPIQVTNSAGTAMSPGDFTVTGAPVITGFAPGSAAIGQWVSVAGENFFQISEVTFNGVPAEFQPVSQTALYAKVRAGVTDGPIQVNNWLGTAASETPVTIIGAPAVSGFTPAWGRTGTVVTISGTNFAKTTGVRFGQVSASFVVISDTEIQATVPEGATTSRITVINPAGYSTSTNRFWILSS